MLLRAQEGKKGTVEGNCQIGLMTSNTIELCFCHLYVAGGLK